MFRLSMFGCWLCVFTLMSTIALLNREHTEWRIATHDVLSRITGGDPNCNVRCSTPVSCPGGSSFSCIDVACDGSGSCPTSSGTHHTNSDQCSGCGKAATGKMDCNGSSTEYCTVFKTCGDCAWMGMSTGWACGGGSSDFRDARTDKFPNGAACP